MALGLPKVEITFKQEGITAIDRGSTGVIALILKEADSSKIKPCVVYDSTDIPNELKEDNKRLVLDALKGYTNAPNRIELFVVDTETNDLNKALDYFETIDFDYLAYPEAQQSDKTAIETYIKNLRDTLGIKRKAVLANQKSDHEGIVNFTQSEIEVGEKTYTTGEFTARIAGILAGTDLRISCTYADVPEVDSIPSEKRTATEAKVKDGELVLFRECGKIKIARGINSLTTTSEVKGSSFQKIKVVDIMDLITNDITRVAKESYLGKYSNSYDNKCLLMSAIDGYLSGLVADGLIEKGTIKVDIDMERQKAFLKGIGVKIQELTEKEIKEYNTQDKIFLEIRCKILDAIEDIKISCII